VNACLGGWVGAGTNLGAVKYHEGGEGTTNAPVR